MTAGPAKVIRARAPKLAIRWKSMPMVRRNVRKALGPRIGGAGVEPAAGPAHCDGLSQPAWRCISGCGACCRLDPALRGEALLALDPDQRRRYLELVGPDGWCLHFDTGARRCRIYDNRPDFCRVENLMRLFGAEGEEADALAIRCCTEQIRSEWGGRGRVMRRFQRAHRKRR
jgi:Fe-S-cluster containining protein